MERAPPSGIAGIRTLVSALERAEDSAGALRVAAAFAHHAGWGDTAAWCIGDAGTRRVIAYGDLLGMEEPPWLVPEGAPAAPWGPSPVVRRCLPGRAGGVLVFEPGEAVSEDWLERVELVAELTSAALRRIALGDEAAPPAALHPYAGEAAGSPPDEVTEERMALREAEAVHARLRDLVHSIDAIVWEAAPGANELSFVSEWAERVLGYPLQDWFAPFFWESILHPEDAERARKASRDALSEGRDHEHEYRVIARDGREVWLHDFVRVLRAPDGTQAGVRGVMVDVSARMRAERERDRINAQLLHTQKLESLGLLACGVAHDFNNLLAVILGNASLAQLRAGPASALYAPLEDVIASARRAEALTGQLLAFAGKAPVQMARIDLSANVRDIAGLLESLVSKKVSLELHLSTRLPPIVGDAMQLQQVVMNLVMNAAEAVGDRIGQVVVSTDVRSLAGGREPDGTEMQAGEYAALQVRDTGEGMTAEVRARIFDPFFSTKALGRGLGLSAVGGIVRAHHGTIAFESTPGRGTRVTVLLPAAQGEVMVEKEPAVLPEGGHGTILVVDDEPDVRATARLMLEYLGYTVVEATDGCAALSILRDTPELVQGVLLDITMPIMDGEEVFARIREMHPRLPVVMSSGYNESSGIGGLRSHGAVEFLKKPYTVQELRDVMRLVRCPA